MPQSDILYALDERFEYDFIGRMEDFQHGFQHIFGVPASVRNATDGSSRHEITHYFTPDLEARFYACFRRDFERLGFQRMRF